MNTIQKICIIITVTAITAYFASFQTGTRSERIYHTVFSYATKVPGTWIPASFHPGTGLMKQAARETGGGHEYSLNWIAVISAMALVGSGLGFFLFKDK